jgi:putative DNA methylase
MQWAFAETNPLAGAGGDIEGTAISVAENLDRLGLGPGAEISQAIAQENHFPEHVTLATDPPYYDNIGYADLSDFFYVWHRRTLRAIHPDLFRRVLTPKAEELIAAPYRDRRPISVPIEKWELMSSAGRADAFFMHEMRRALSAISSSTTGAPTTIFYAFKQSELAADGLTSAGWAAFLQAAADSGLAVDGTWPLRTEATNALKKDVNALGYSIIMACRQRNPSAETITRAEFLRALRRELPAALAKIRHAGVGPTDIQQAAHGPGIEIFLRHADVLNTDGTPILVGDALKLINQAREEVTSQSDADYDSETRFALDWFAAKGFNVGPSAEAINMTNAVNLSLDAMNAAGFFEAASGKARLKKRNELPHSWDPKTAKRSTVWEGCQHLIKRLNAEDGGVDAAAALYNRLGAVAQPSHALARRLYDICEQRHWAAEGRAYNQLDQEWDAIEARAAALAVAGAKRDLFTR